MKTAPTVTLDHVHAGDRLPTLTIDVTPTTVVLGAMAARDWRPMHHDYAFATQRNGVRDIFFTTPNQAAWFERYITDWSGPHGRLAHMQFAMTSSVFPGHSMTFEGMVTAVSTDHETACGWVELSVTLTTRQRIATRCTARLALPTAAVGNPWSLTGPMWAPEC